VHRSAATVAGLTVVVGILVGVAVVGTAGVATESVAAQPTNETNTTQHENPETVSEQGDSARLRGWLSDRLTDRLRESSVRISQGQYERVDDVFDEEFEQRLGQYVDVTGGTDGGTTDAGDDDTGDGSDAEEQTAFGRAQTEQVRLASFRQEYDETYTAYREARERGDSATARQRARQLQQRASAIRRTGRNLTRTLRSIENETGVDTSESQQRIERVLQNTAELQEAVETETFIETKLTVTTNRTAASFVDPVRVRGQLVSENGTAVTNRSMRVQVGTRVLRATSGDNGTFAVTYRPTLVRVDAGTVPVRYRPTPASPYSGTETNVSLDIEQVEPTLDLSVTPDRAQFGDELTVEAALSVDDRSVPNVPVRAALVGRVLGERPTGSTGTARFEGTVPADTPLSGATVDAVVVPEDRAIGPVNASTELQLRETQTDLSLSAQITPRGIVVEGRLVATTENGEAVAVPSQPVVVTLGDTTRRARTDAEGRYDATVAVAAVTASEVESPSLVRAQFDDSGTILESARSETSLNASRLAAAIDQAGSAADTNQADGDAVTFPTWARAGVVVVLLLGVGVLARRWGRRRGDDGENMVDESVALADDASRRPESADRSPLADARGALSAGATDRAVIAAYATARTSLVDRFDVGKSQTPREFLSACDRRLDSETYAALQTLTETYEQTVFAPEAADTANQAVDAAQSLLDTGTSRQGETGDD